MRVERKMKAQICRVGVIVAILSKLSMIAKCEPYVKLSSDGPAILDSAITFSATLFPDGHDGPFYFRWSDDASPGHFQEQKVDGRFANLTLVYSSQTYEASHFVMTLRVYKEITFFREELAFADVKYSITKQLNGRLALSQNGSVVDASHLVKSTQNVDITVDLHDPSHFLHDAVIQYFWFLNDTNYGLSDNATFKYRFEKPGTTNVEAMVMAKVGRDASHKTGLQNVSEDMTSSDLVERAPPYMKIGVFRVRIKSKTPMTRLNMTGETWLKHGKLLNLELTCDGSGPWSYCWKMMEKSYNSTGDETCESIDKSPIVLTESCAFPIVWYLRQNGIYDFLAVVDDGVAHRVELIHVNVYEIHPQTQLSIVIVPIVCVLLAGMALASGIISVMMFRRNVAVETADFDFTSPDEQLEYKTFWERLRDSMLNAFATASDDVSHASSVSSRSVQPVVTGIHYGSIS